MVCETPMVPRWATSGQKHNVINTVPVFIKLLKSELQPSSNFTNSFTDKKKLWNCNFIYSHVKVYQTHMLLSFFYCDFSESWMILKFDPDS